ncbi:SDR family NAD(P)-dependent oxidoreductase [Brevibacillus massiliensis]|jgi:2-deoxy-D-gluconate 3-dehydrogenase|uniref:SDR family NAD(P)-dependent oxidoreductase n=1 Tax=Brevibacillus massiliensis TaxID=1118054 RepID=UPI0002DB6EE1|nr:glucose 1-dehydrogenase [Brevibacillus massiliensis]
MKKVAIVTGGASGLGNAVVRELADQGLAVAVIDVAIEQGESLEQEFTQQGKDLKFIYADVSVQEETRRAAALVHEHFSRIDYLVNAAGIIKREAAVRLQADDLRQVLDINLCGSVFMCQAVQPYMVQSGGGAIVNFASMLAHYGSKNLLAYAASKGGIVQVTKCLAVEWAEYNIRVNAVSPGYIQTNLSQGAVGDPVFRERILSRTPQGRFGLSGEVASAIQFLLGDHAQFITGVDLPVDGGILAGDPALFPPVPSVK